MKHAWNQQKSSPPGCPGYPSFYWKDLTSFDIQGQNPKGWSPFTRYTLSQGTNLATSRLNIMPATDSSLHVRSQVAVHVKHFDFYLGCLVFSFVTYIVHPPFPLIALLSAFFLDKFCPYLRPVAVFIYPLASYIHPFDCLSFPSPIELSYLMSRDDCPCNYLYYWVTERV